MCHFHPQELSVSVPSSSRLLECLEIFGELEPWTTFLFYGIRLLFFDPAIFKANRNSNTYSETIEKMYADTDHQESVEPRSGVPVTVPIRLYIHCDDSMGASRELFPDPKQDFASFQDLLGELLVRA